MDPFASTLLALSLAALVGGPLLYGAARLSGRMMAALDGFVLVAMGGLVLLQLLPASAALAETTSDGGPGPRRSRSSSVPPGSAAARSARKPSASGSASSGRSST